MEKSYMDFLRQITIYKELVRYQKEYQRQKTSESTRQYLQELIEKAKKEIDVEKTLSDWKKVKPFASQKENYEKSAQLPRKTRPLYIGMLYLMNHGVLELLPIYEDIIYEKLYNPNAEYELEGRRIFWENLPDPFALHEPRFIVLNQEVMGNHYLDFHIGGTLHGKINFYLDQIEHPWLYSEDSVEEKKYYIGLLTRAIKNNLNILDTHRETWGMVHLQDAYIKRILDMNPQEVQKEWQEFRAFLFSMECIKRQCEISWRQDQVDTEALEMYIEKIPQDEQYEEKKNCLQLLRR